MKTSEKIIVWRNHSAIEQMRELITSVFENWKVFNEAFNSLELNSPLTVDDINEMKADWDANQSPGSALEVLLLRKIKIESPSFGKITVDKRQQLRLLDLSGTVGLTKILEKNGSSMFGYVQFIKFENTGPVINEEILMNEIVDPHTIYALQPAEIEIYKTLKEFLDITIRLNKRSEKLGIPLLLGSDNWSWVDYKLYDLLEQLPDNSHGVNRQFYLRLVERLPTDDKA